MIISKAEVKGVLLRIVEESGGIKNVDLALAVLSKWGQQCPDSMLILETINELVHEGDIRELEYSLPHLPYRAKSIYFPKRTQFKLSQAKK